MPVTACDTTGAPLGRPARARKAATTRALTAPAPLCLVPLAQAAGGADWAELLEATDAERLHSVAEAAFTDAVLRPFGELWGTDVAGVLGRAAAP